MAGELLRISVNQIGLESAEASLKRGEAGTGTLEGPPTNPAGTGPDRI